MPLNKLDNFIKNTEGRILYVSPSDLDATDSIDNQGNSLARPFKTIQRAILESARFSYLKGSSNDLIEKTTILLMPGEHTIDNRPGFKIKNVGGAAKVVSPSGGESDAATVLDLNLGSNFDITQEDNVLYKFNSVNGGVIVPRGTSIVGLDLRKTKIRPLYVPNPTDISTSNSAIFRITGTCYFWQFSFFDGDENGLVYTDPSDFSDNNRSKPIFSHHKLTAFEYADGVNLVDRATYGTLTDLDMYYAKLSNAYNTSSGTPARNIDSKYPANPEGFAKQRPEWEIVGAFAADQLSISAIEAGSGGTPTNQVTVTTVTDHNLTAGTPIKISGVDPEDYNVSTKVQLVDETNPRVFTYQLPTFRKNLPTPGDASGGGEVTIETDTVTGASPYIFNISMRSVYGMNGMHADGSKASGFRSMVVAQFTGVSLQKDDRAFVKYNKSSRSYTGIPITKVAGAVLSNESSSTDSERVYHLDTDAIYRSGWETTHIKASNDAILQIVSVFAIGYNKHFEIASGGDASITNSNSNFGQLSLVSEGFKKEAFDKDNKAFITNIIPPRSNVVAEEEIDWLTIDVGITTSVGSTTKLYLREFTSEDDIPPTLTQGYRVGAKVNDKLFVKIDDVQYEANILMENGVDNSLREFDVSAVASSKFIIDINHGIQTGEKVILLSDDGNYPENITPHATYFAIAFNQAPDLDKIQLAPTKVDAENGNFITVYGGTKLRVQSRVTDKRSGEAGHPVQFDSSQNRWFINVNTSNTIYPKLLSSGVAGIGAETDPTFIKRKPDNRSLDERVYKFRVVIPKELVNGKNPESGFVIQESSTTEARDANDFTLSDITINDFNFRKNNRFIAKSTHNPSTLVSTITTELPHNLEVGEKVVIRNITCSNNTDGVIDEGYNGTFTIATVPNNMEFTYTNSQLPGTSSTNDTSVRDQNLPRFERNDTKSNFYIYRTEVIDEYIEGTQNGVYHLYALKSDTEITNEFTNLQFSQNVTDFYPQQDRDNVDDSPPSTKTFAPSFPLGQVVTSDLKGSITRETSDKLFSKLNKNLTVSSVTAQSAGISTITFTRDHGLNRAITGTLSAGSGSRNSGTHYNVKLYNDAAFNTWSGATAKVVVNNSGNITSAEIQAQGSGYSDNNELFFDTTVIGGNQDAKITLATAGIATAIGDVVQVTGIGTVSDAYYRIANVPDTNKIGISRTTGDPSIFANHLVIPVGKSVEITSSSFDSTTKISTFNCSGPHGLVAGNKFRVIDTSNNNLGDFLVKSKTSVSVFTAETTSQLVNPKFVLQHYFSSNSGVSDRSNENIAGRGKTIYGHDELTIDNSGLAIGISTTLIPVIHPSSGIGLTARFPIGSYVQVEDEIMRISSSDITGTNKLSVLRGLFSTNVSAHPDGSLIRKINILPVEFRRPSTVRASGHTFEYLGYGPGNYSTGLPQVQTKSLSEKEEFLSQAQERSAGIVVYTGMNNRGDFYIGNTKKSSATGEETSFDTPIPTVTGEDPARLSAVFDEVTIKERIIVEGGDSGEILSQFDGPVTFNNDVRVKDTLALSGRLRVLNTTESTNTNSGAIIVDGGVGIDGNLYLGGVANFGGLSLTENLYVAGISTLGANGGITTTGGDLFVGGATTTTNLTAGNLQVAVTDDNTIDSTSGNLKLDAPTGAYVAIQTNTTITGVLSVTDDITAFWTSDERLKDNINAIEQPLNKVVSISGNTFDWNEKSNKTGHDVGLIAQEIEQVLPEAVVTRDNGYLAVDYHKIVPLLVEAIKELSSKVETLEQKLSDK